MDICDVADRARRQEQDPGADMRGECHGASQPDPEHGQDHRLGDEDQDERPLPPRHVAEVPPLQLHPHRPHHQDGDTHHADVENGLHEKVPKRYRTPFSL